MAWLGPVGLLELRTPALDAQLLRRRCLTPWEPVVMSDSHFASSSVMQAKGLVGATDTTPARLPHVVSGPLGSGQVEKAPRQEGGHLGCASVTAAAEPGVLGEEVVPAVVAVGSARWWGRGTGRARGSARRDTGVVVLLDQEHG